MKHLMMRLGIALAGGRFWGALCRLPQHLTPIRDLK